MLKVCLEWRPCAGSTGGGHPSISNLIATGAVIGDGSCHQMLTFAKFCVVVCESYLFFAATILYSNYSVFAPVRRFLARCLCEPNVSPSPSVRERIP